MVLKQLDSRRVLIFYLLFFSFFVCISQSYNLTFQQFLNDKPTTFGLLTVTHARNGNYQYFKKHLNSYAGMDCPLLTEISVAWNNDVTPESVGFVQDPQWKIPVYFIKTPFNAMDFRYLLPQQSKAKVFFNIDDDIITPCQQLVKSFQIWKQIAIGDLSPILSYGPRAYDFNSTTNTYIYNDPLKAKFHSMSLVGVGWIPRVFLQLYYSQNSWEIKQMRKIIKEKNNCDDIGLNFMVNYYFPELVPTFLTGNLNYAIHPSSQALSKNHYPFRNECLKLFSQIFGYNPLRLINIYDKGNPLKFASKAKRYILYLRRKQISEKLIEKKQSVGEIPNDLIQNWASKLKVESQKPQLRNEIQNNKNNENEQTIKMQLQMLKSQYSNEVLQIKKKSEQFKKLVEEKNYKSSNKDMKSDNELKTENIQNLKNTLKRIAIIGVFLSIFVLCMFIYLVADCKQCNSTESQQKQEEQEEQEET